MQVVYSFPHPLGRPGIGTTAAWQVRGLIERGVDVRLYTTSLACEVRGAREIVETMVVADKRIPHRAIGVDRAYGYHDWRVARALRSIGGDVDVVHAWPLGARRTFVEARRHGVLSFKVIPNTHTASAYARAREEAAAVGITMPAGHSHDYDAGRLAHEEEEYRLADVLLVASPYVERTFLDRGYPQEKLVLHQFGFDPASFPAPPEEPERRADAPLRAAFVGSCEPRKGLHHALRAWIDSGVAERGRFVICGRFVAGYREAVADLLRHPSVVELGFVGDVGAVLRKADVFFAPSVEEGSALVTYEAQASGCVLLVSDAAGALCSHLDSALVHRAGDVATLAEHLGMLDRDRRLLARLRARTLERRVELTWSCAGERLAAIYAERLAHAHAPPR